MSDSFNDILETANNEELLKAEREDRWMAGRVGKLTGSPAPKYMKETKTKYFGDTAITELLYTKYERRTGRRRHEVTCKNFDFGHENEPLAMDNWRKKHPDLELKSFSEDFEDVVTFSPMKNLMISPDGGVYKDGKLIKIVEVKCNVAESSFEDMLDVDSIDDTHQYYWQFIAELASVPEVDELVWINYDAYGDELHEVSMFRKDHKKNIAKYLKKMKQANDYIDLCIENPSEYKMRGINDWCKLQLENE